MTEHITPRASHSDVPSFRLPKMLPHEESQVPVLVLAHAINLCSAAAQFCSDDTAAGDDVNPPGDRVGAFPKEMGANGLNIDDGANTGETPNATGAFVEFKVLVGIFVGEDVATGKVGAGAEDAGRKEGAK